MEQGERWHALQPSATPLLRNVESWGHEARTSLTACEFVQSAVNATELHVDSVYLS